MRGIQINNYFNNHITLNGKKVNQESQPVLQTAKTRLHNPHPQEPDNHSEAKPIIHKNHPLPPKKRTNTLVELKKRPKRSTSADRQRNAASARKKDQAISYESQKEEEPLTNMSQKRLKPHSNKGGLGKRSKSTIIKTTNPDTYRTGQDTARREPKKISSHNPTDESMKMKAKRKKSSRVIEHSKQLKKESRPNTARRQYIPIASKQVPSKKEKLGLKLDKGEDRKNQSQQIKPSSKRKGSKPVSAREKKPRKEKFIDELKKKYEDQLILQGQRSNRLPDSNEENIDNDFLSVMSSLEKVLTSVGSKQKLRKQLDLINQKLRQFKIDSQGEQPEDEELQANKLQQAEKKEKIYFENSQHSEGEKDDKQQYLNQDLDLDRSNPLTHKRFNEFVFADELEPHRHEQIERKKQIQMLKQFRNQSTKIFQKVGLNPQQRQGHRIQKQLSNSNGANHPSDQEIQQKKEENQDQKNLTFVRKPLFINNESGLSSSSGGLSMKEDVYPQGIRSPRFDEGQLLGFITMKEQFMSNKRDKMSQLVKRMFEKQLVSPRSYENQLKALNKKFEDQHLALENIRKQAQQMSAMLSQIQKDRQEIQGIDQLIRNEQWDQARQLVKIPPTIIQEPEQQFEKTEGSKKEAESWEKEQGWERVCIAKEQEKPAFVKDEDVQDNEFVDLAEMSTRVRRKAEAKIDLDDECGGTEESIELQDGDVKQEQIIHYQGDKSEEQSQGAFMKLVQIEEHKNSEPEADPNQNVFHIECEEMGSKEFGGSGIDRNISGVSSQGDRKGFTTNLYFIKEYCIALCQFVRDHQLFKSHFKDSISLPLQFNLPKLLADLKKEDLTTYLYSGRTKQPAIPEDVWNDFNAQYDTLKYNSNMFRTGERYTFEKQQEIIFLRMIFDVLNESLDAERPGSQFGKALPWKDGAKHLKNLKQMKKPEENNIEAYDLTFGVAIARIIQWGSCLCGFLPDTVELENTEIDEPYVNHIRETRMAFLLEKMMAAEEPLMTNFELQETEVEHKVAQLLMEQILHEATRDIRQVFKSDS